MKIESSALISEEKVPPRFTCDGEDVLPPLSLSGVPEKAKSLAIFMDDPDSVAGTWSHWVAWNIPVDTKEVTEELLAKSAVQGENDFGNVGYGGPCPQEGVHRYFFTLYALDTVLDLPEKSKSPAVKKALKEHIVDVAELQVWYSRTK